MGYRLSSQSTFEEKIPSPPVWTGKTERLSHNFNAYTNKIMHIWMVFSSRSQNTVKFYMG
jgi:hypothetical protein